MGIKVWSALVRPGPGRQVPFIRDKATISTQKLIQNPVRRVIDINLKSTVVETCLWLTTTVVDSRFYRLESPSSKLNPSPPAASRQRPYPPLVSK